jgi:hypothetical protein
VRLRKETTLTVKAIAARVHLGTPRSASVLLYEWAASCAPAEPAQGELPICKQPNRVWVGPFLWNADPWGPWMVAE